jgi:hypothetical protein
MSCQETERRPATRAAEHGGHRPVRAAGRETTAPWVGWRAVLPDGVQKGLGRGTQTHPPIPYSVEDCGDNLRKILWGKVKPKTTAEGATAAGDRTGWGTRTVPELFRPAGATPGTPSFPGRNMGVLQNRTRKPYPQGAFPCTPLYRTRPAAPYYGNTISLSLRRRGGPPGKAHRRYGFRVRFSPHGRTAPTSVFPPGKTGGQSRGASPRLDGRSDHGGTAVISPP